MAGNGTKFGDFDSGVLNDIMSSIGSVRDLGNFVSVSHDVDQTFKPMSRNILPRVLRNELGPVYLDAQFVFLLSLRGHPDMASLWNEAESLAAIYKDLANPRSVASNAVELTPDGLTQMCRVLHNVNYLTEIYITTLQRRLDSEGAVSGPATATASGTEQKRIQRAFYRRQMICYTWTPDEADPDDGQEGNRLSVLSLLNSFQSWELQQIDHVEMFITWLCLALCIAAERASLPISQDQFEALFRSVDNLAQHMQAHPDIVEAALQLPFSLEELTKTAGAYEAFADKSALLCLKSSWQRLREDPFDASEGRPVSFVGDEVDLPPFAWVNGVAETHVKWFGDALLTGTKPDAAGNDDHAQDRTALRYSQQVWREVGFSVWDKERAKAMLEMDQYSVYKRGWITEKKE